MNPAPDNRQPQAEVPRPTSGKENNKAFYYAIGGAAVVLAIVLSFNFAGPSAPGQQTDLGQNANSTTSSPAAPTSPSNPSSPSTPPSASPSTETVVPPQRGDTPNSPGRESVGAPVGGGAPSADPLPPAGGAIIDLGTTPPPAPTASATQ